MATAFEKHGALTVQGTQLTDKDGAPFQLKYRARSVSYGIRNILTKLRLKRSAAGAAI